MAKSTKFNHDANTCRHLMLCEGYSDLYFLVAALMYLKADLIHWPVILQSEGKANLKSKNNFKNIAKIIEANSNLHSVSVFIDADESAADTIQSIQNVAKSEWNRDIAEGQWLGDSPRIGLFVFPDGQSQGELETLVWNAIPDDNQSDFQFKSMKDQVGQHLDVMKSLGWLKHNPSRNLDKAKIGTYLAAAWDDDPRVGPAAAHRKPDQSVTIDFSWPGFQPLVDFLRPLATTS